MRWWLLPAVLLAIGCSNSAAERAKRAAGTDKVFAGKYPIRAVATTGMVADLIKNIGGERIEVAQLMGQGVDPHLYKASVGDLRKLEAADMIFYSGLHLEGKMGEIFEGLAKKRPTFAVGELIKDITVLEDDDKSHDPHIWFDVSLWSKAAGVVGDVLSQFDPSNSTEYQKRTSDYRGELAKLHDYARTQIATIPKDRRVLVTAHDAFRYFGRAYDIDVKGIQGISTEAEASVKDVNELVNLLVQRKIKAVFVETSVNPRNVQALIQGCQAKGHTVAIGGELYSDAMGKDGTAEGTYVGMVKHNVDTIVRALK